MYLAAAQEAVFETDAAANYCIKLLEDATHDAEAWQQQV
jgi:hypothetical protein